jgi:hypothetical protein
MMERRIARINPSTTAAMAMNTSESVSQKVLMTPRAERK